MRGLPFYFYWGRGIVGGFIGKLWGIYGGNGKYAVEVNKSRKKREFKPKGKLSRRDKA